MQKPDLSRLALLAGASLASALLVAGAGAMAGTTDAAAFKSFSRENDVAMDKMMSAMAIKPSGDVDRDFAGMMIPHHRGAIDMALAELRHGKNEQLRRIAQEIIVEQQQEIDAMHLALGEAVTSAGPAPTQAGASAEATMPDMPSMQQHHPSNH